MDVAEPIALDQRPDETGENRRQDQPRPETDELANLKSEEGAEHIEARMREVQNAHHAEDEREPARDEKEQHAVEHAVQGRNEDELKQGGPPQDAKSNFFYYCS